MNLERINGTGLALTGSDGEHIKQMRVYREGISVQFWVELSDGREVFQYLDAEEAMSLSAVLDGLAVEVLRERGNGWR